MFWSTTAGAHCSEWKDLGGLRCIADTVEAPGLVCGHKQFPFEPCSGQAVHTFPTKQACVGQVKIIPATDP